jgi:hypothetical protein
MTIELDRIPLLDALVLIGPCAFDEFYTPNGSMQCNAMNPCHNPWIMHGMAQFGMEHVTCVKENEEDYFCKSSVGNGLHFLVAVKAFLS